MLYNKKRKIQCKRRGGERIEETSFVTALTSFTSLGHLLEGVARMIRPSENTHTRTCI